MRLLVWIEAPPPRALRRVGQSKRRPTIGKAPLAGIGGTARLVSMLIWDRTRGVCRVVWDREDSGPVWLEFAYLGGSEQHVPMYRVEGCWVAEIPGQTGWLRYGFRTPVGLHPDNHRATVRDHLGRRLSFAVISQSAPTTP